MNNSNNDFLADLQFFNQYISNEKKSQLLKINRKEEAHRKLLADILLRVLITQRLKIGNSAIEFEYNRFGKPFLKGNNTFHFNISHSGNWIICVVDSELVGIDIEQMKSIDLEIAKRFFSNEEVKFLFKANKQDQLERFYDLWTLKESYLKAIGVGLSKSLRAFSISLSNCGSQFTLTDLHSQSDQCSESQYWFKQYCLDPGYKLSVCCKSNEFAEKINLVQLTEIKRKIRFLL